MYFVYAIHNERHNKIYIGQTDNLLERIELHNRRIFKHYFTARFDGTWKLIYKESASTRAEALMREKQLKSYKGRQFIKNFIPG